MSGWMLCRIALMRDLCDRLLIISLVFDRNGRPHTGPLPSVRIASLRLRPGPGLMFLARFLFGSRVRMFVSAQDGSKELAVDWGGFLLTVRPFSSSASPLPFLSSPLMSQSRASPRPPQAVAPSQEYFLARNTLLVCGNPAPAMVGPEESLSYVSAFQAAWVRPPGFSWALVLV